MHGLMDRSADVHFAHLQRQGRAALRHSGCRRSGMNSTLSPAPQPVISRVRHCCPIRGTPFDHTVHDFSRTFLSCLSWFSLDSAIPSDTASSVQKLLGYDIFTFQHHRFFVSLILVAVSRAYVPRTGSSLKALHQRRRSFSRKGSG